MSSDQWDRFSELLRDEAQAQTLRDRPEAAAALYRASASANTVAAEARDGWFVRRFGRLLGRVFERVRMRVARFLPGRLP